MTTQPTERVARARARAGALDVELCAFEREHGCNPVGKPPEWLAEHERLLRAKQDADATVRVLEHEDNCEIHIPGTNRDERRT